MLLSSLIGYSNFLTNHNAQIIVGLFYVWNFLYRIGPSWQNMFRVNGKMRFKPLKVAAAEVTTVPAVHTTTDIDWKSLEYNSYFKIFTIPMSTENLSGKKYSKRLALYLGKYALDKNS